MPEGEAQVGGRPCADEVRGALEHMAASEAFRGSPQLVAFLRYVVEATLRGAGDRIKGYTIAVEALGRGESFDPQADPIVRVEAMRLRRALSRYYANGGARDPVVIDLPLGSYVPAFRRAPQQPMVPVARPDSPLALPGRRRRSVREYLHRVAAGIALVLLGAGVYGALDFWFDFNTPRSQVSPALLAAPARAAAPAWRAHPTYPAVFVGPFQPADGHGGSLAEALRGKLRDALARFDEIQVVARPPDERAGDAESAPSRYGLTASVAPEAGGKVSVSVRLTDAADGQVAYAHTFTREQQGFDLVPGDDAMVREVSAALAQPYGIIQARERGKEFAPSGGDENYRCLIVAYDYWRTYDPRQHARARDCLERATAATPGFALGFAALAAIALEEYRLGVNPRSDEAPPLRRALAAARRAVELKPGSARAHQTLAEVQFARGDYPLAIEAGERALVLNPYDPNVIAHYGAQLFALGDQERGARLIKEAASAIVVRPAWHDFFLFLGAYLAGDRGGAERYAALLPSDAYPPGLLARGLVAVQRGEADHARQLFDRLAVLSPGWRDDSRRELKKYVAADSIVNRVARDLGQLGHIAGQ